MSQPVTIRVAYDTGNTDGDPGDGRLRFDAAKIQRAKFLMVNARCAQESILDDLVPKWKIGDVIIVERLGKPDNRVVCWVIGPVYHGGPYYKVPISVRSFDGSFAAHDELSLTHHADVDAANARGEALPIEVAPLPRIAPRMAPAEILPPAPVLDTEPELITLRGELERLRAERDAARADADTLQSIIKHLVSDETEVYVIEGNR